MKQLKFILIIVIFIGIIGCEKEDPKTTYSFKNNSSQMLYGFSTYYWDGATSINQIYHGNIGLGQETDKFDTENPQISFSFSFDPGGIIYVGVNPYTVNKGMHNSFVIDNYTAIYGGTTYYILNSSSFTIYNLASYYWTGIQILDYVDYGTLNIGYRTMHVQTNKNAIDLGFTFEPGGETFITANPFIIVSNTINLIEITNYTEVYNSEQTIESLFNNPIADASSKKKYKLGDLLKSYAK